jgi:hypothetical protein
VLNLELLTSYVVALRISIIFLSSKEIVMIKTPSATVFMPTPGLESNPKPQYVQPKLERHQRSKEIVMIETPSAIDCMSTPSLESKPQYVTPKLERHQWSAVTGYSMPVGSVVDPSNLNWVNDVVNEGGNS